MQHSFILDHHRISITSDNCDDAICLWMALRNVVNSEAISDNNLLLGKNYTIFVVNNGFKLINKFYTDMSVEFMCHDKFSLDICFDLAEKLKTKVYITDDMLITCTSNNDIFKTFISLYETVKEKLLLPDEYRKTLSDISDIKLGNKNLTIYNGNYVLINNFTAIWNGIEIHVEGHHIYIKQMVNIIGSIKPKLSPIYGRLKFSEIAYNLIVNNKLLGSLLDQIGMISFKEVYENGFYYVIGTCPDFREPDKTWSIRFDTLDGKAFLVEL